VVGVAAPNESRTEIVAVVPGFMLAKMNKPAASVTVVDRSVW
jgi:hypothetical protein